MWALMASPILVATDIRNMTDIMKEVTNKPNLIVGGHSDCIIIIILLYLFRSCSIKKLSLSIKTVLVQLVEGLASITEMAVLMYVCLDLYCNRVTLVNCITTVEMMVY